MCAVMRKNDVKSGFGEGRSFFWSSCWSGSGLAVFLIILGAFFLARDFNLIPENVSFWAFALILLGVFLLFNKKNKC